MSRPLSKRLLPQPLLSLFLLFIWLLLMNDLGLGHWLMGALLGWLIPLLTHLFWERTPKLYKPVKLCLFFLRILGDIVFANLQVAKLIIGSTAKLRPAFVEVPLDTDNEFVITVLASVVSLTPGTVSADISADRRTLLVHGLDVEDRAALVASIKQRYEAPLKEIFGC